MALAPLVEAWGGAVFLGIHLIADYHLTWMVGAPVEDTISIMQLTSITGRRRTRRNSRGFYITDDVADHRPASSEMTPHCSPVLGHVCGHRLGGGSPRAGR